MMYHDDYNCSGGIGSLPNEKVHKCKICASNGFPHEPIIFKKIIVEKWQPFDYFNPRIEHKHKEASGNK